jgi:hypothetical protein
MLINISLDNMFYDSREVSILITTNLCLTIQIVEYLKRYGMTGL